jgi:hypothetical protein
LNRIFRIAYERRVALLAENAQFRSLEPQTGFPPPPPQQQQQHHPHPHPHQQWATEQQGIPLGFGQQTYSYPFSFTSGVELPQLNFLDDPTTLLYNLDEGFDPMDYTRAIENEFAMRNWHESWWNGEGDL